jgi:type IV secretion system protein VirB10
VHPDNDVSPENKEQGGSADRGMPSLTQPHGGNTKFILKAITVLLVVGIMIAVGVSFGANKWKEYRQHAAEERLKKADSKPNIGRLDTSTLSDHPSSSSSTAAPPGVSDDLPPPPSKTRSGQASDGRPGSTAADAQQRADAEAAAREAARTRVADAPILAFGSDDKTKTSTDDAHPQSQTAGDTVLAAMRAHDEASKLPVSETTSLASSLKGTSAPDRVATQAANMSLTISQGTVMHCGLVTAIDSTVPGFVKCIITEDVYSANGRAVLVERGSEVSGQYESASLKQGMSRIFVLWTRLRTPHGVTITLDSPSTDALGRSGVDGVINNHFWQRVGSGLLLSVVDDVTASAMNRGGGGNQVQFSSTSSEGKDAASIALTHSIDIPPTLTKDQGAQLNVWVASDLYFGGVYAFRSAQR